MTPNSLLLILLVLSAAAYRIGKRKANAAGIRLHSRPAYHGALAALWCAVPALLLFGLWQACQDRILLHLVASDLPAPLRTLPPERLGLVLNDVKNLVQGNIVSEKVNPAIQAAADHYQSLQATGNAALAVIVLTLAMSGLLFMTAKIKPALRARNHVETITRHALIACATAAVFTTVGIVLSLLVEAVRFFKIIPVQAFLFGLKWSPQMAIRADQVGSSGAFGAVPVFTGTLLIAAIAMVVAVPVGLMSAIYLSEYAGHRFRSVAKPLIEILAGIPTVVYGFFAALTVAPFIRGMGSRLGLDVSSESALAAGAVMGVMIIPLIWLARCLPGTTRWTTFNAKFTA
ncbi:MAG: phosphate ABC transporter permease family protein [Desulfobacterales bacterium]|nr:phosphate ABC transporter permease family protein [Desulfobacterales bacterium]